MGLICRWPPNCPSTASCFVEGIPRATVDVHLYFVVTVLSLIGLVINGGITVDILSSSPPYPPQKPFPPSCDSSDSMTFPPLCGSGGPISSRKAIVCPNNCLILLPQCWINVNPENGGVVFVESSWQGGSCRRKGAGGRARCRMILEQGGWYAWSARG